MSQAYMDCGSSVYSSQQKASSSQTEIVSQVFFFPRGDNFAREATSFLAYCPFTRISAEGDTLFEAAQNWCIVARQYIASPLIIPKYLFTQRKVWYGELEGGNGMFVLDFNFATKIVGISPATRKTAEFSSVSLHASLTLLPPLLIDDPSKQLRRNEVAWEDVVVKCTPLMHLEIDDHHGSSSPMIHSLTPHCIN